MEELSQTNFYVPGTTKEVIIRKTTVEMADSGPFKEDQEMLDSTNELPSMMID